MNLEELRARVGDLAGANQELVQTADTEGRELTEEETARIDANLAEIERLQADISRRERIAASVAATSQGQGRRTVPDAVAAQGSAQGGQGRASVPAQARRDDPRNGFRSFGEFAMAVRKAGPGQQPDNRLLGAATTYGNEGTGADGGFAVPQEFRRDIWQKVMGEDNLLTRCDQIVTGSNNMTVPKDETTPWQTTGGIQVYWESEGAAANASKPLFETSTLRLHKLMALVPVTEELLEDAPGLESWLRGKAPQKMVAKINDAIIDGTGAGQPLGILRAPCTVSVAKESSQAGDSILFANVVNMWSRMYAPSRRNAIWLINQDVEPQLQQMAFDPGADSKVPVYLGPNGVAGSPYATMMGRPVVPVEACKTLGDKGDIILADLTQYMVLTRGTEIRTDVSMHLYFDQAITAFRFIFRLNGQPWWGAAITPQNGSNTRSAFVTLDERS